MTPWKRRSTTASARSSTAARTPPTRGHGLFQQDVHVIKTLYLIRYIGDITPNVNNIANLMIDSMDVDKVELRREVQASLERLVRENKAARNGDRYNFPHQRGAGRRRRDIQSADRVFRGHRSHQAPALRRHIHLVKTPRGCERLPRSTATWTIRFTARTWAG